MTLHWTIISIELTQKCFCPIGVRSNLFESSSVWSETSYRKLRHL